MTKVEGSFNHQHIMLNYLKIPANDQMQKPSEVSALIRLKNGKSEKREFYYGSSFRFQSARFININENVASVIILNDEGEKRIIQF